MLSAELDARALPAQRVQIHAAAGGTTTVTALDEIARTIESGRVAQIHGAPAVRSVEERSGGEAHYLDE